MVMERRCILKMFECAPLVCLLLQLVLRWNVNATCPEICSCADSHRVVDCSWRGLTHLPIGLEPSIRSLNLSHNRLANLDHLLSSYTHLRTLDISHNRLTHLPTSLPRSLWEIQASGNRIRLLDKEDTAYQWNLRVLDLSYNRLERVVFINNTLPRMRVLNLSHNAFWTVPTNMPRNLDVVDLSHNTLVQILPGSLDRLATLSRLYLHANRFTEVSEGAFEKLGSLKLITLGENPWACEDQDRVGHLLDWSGRTSARVLDCPCHTSPICGEAHLARTGGWHFASYTLSPHGSSSQGFAHLPSQVVTTHYWSNKAFIDTHLTGESPNVFAIPENSKTFKQGFPSTSISDGHIPTDGPFTFNDLLAKDSFFTTSGVLTSSTRRTTTLRTRSVKRASQGLGRNSSSRNSSWDILTILINVLLLVM